MILPLLSALLAGCGDKDTPVDSGTPQDTSAPGWTPSEGGEITLTTRDGLVLAADYHPASAEGRPGVVLVHMIPPGNDRSNWPQAFIDELVGHDWAVINLDRRGAGDSEGTAEDAYEGEAGRYDVEAAVLKLQEEGYGAVGIMGASNGTTSMIDYAAWANGEGLPVPAVLAFLTGGVYTENQTDMKQVVGFPCIFTYQTTESAWSEQQRSLAPGSWEFHEYSGAGHGTQMLESSAAGQVTSDLVGYFAGVLD